VSKAKAKEASSEKAVKADPKKAIVKPARAAPKTESDAHVKAAEKKTTTKPKAKKEASVEDIVSEATSAVDLSPGYRLRSRNCSHRATQGCFSHQR